MAHFARCALSALFLVVTGISARAADVEVRDFVNLIDGKPSGETHMTIKRQDDGSASMSCQADVKVTKLGLVVYRYTYRGTEEWKSGQLVRFESRTDDNGKKYTVLASLEKDGMRLRVLDEERIERVDWPSSYWQLPGAEARKRTIAILDADTGRTVRGAMRYLGTQQITVAGKLQNCFHYRISGPLEVEAWYDGQDRLVRQAWTEDGHPCVLELSNIRR
jgi:hypothetical protein